MKQCQWHQMKTELWNWKWTSMIPCLNWNLIRCSYKIKHSAVINILSTRVKTSLDFSVQTITTASKCIASRSPVGFIKSQNRLVCKRTSRSSSPIIEHQCSDLRSRSLTIPSTHTRVLERSSASPCLASSSAAQGSCGTGQRLGILYPVPNNALKWGQAAA